MRSYYLVFCVLAVLLLSACATVPAPQAGYNPADLQFSGERAYALEAQFVQQFPNRATGLPNSRPAAEWLMAQFTQQGWACRLDQWQIVNYSRPVPLNNVVCELAGQSPQQILVVAHYDQSPDTVQGADNDGSGIAILLHLGEIFAREAPPRYTLVFVAADGEEYGELGSRRYIQTHPDPRQIVAGLSLDNLGKSFYDGMDMDPRGQFRGYGQLWLQLSAQAAARAAGDLWVPQFYAPLFQALFQAVPISFMDEGPMVTAGVPALGFAGHVPDASAELDWQTYHTPLDTLDYQSAAVLYQSGRIPEALLRELLAQTSFPRQPGPYLYFESSRTVLRGLPLWAVFVAFVLVFFLASAGAARRLRGETLREWRAALPYFLALWAPLVAGLLLLYLLVAVGLMDRYELYPATPKDEPLFYPRWPAVIVFLAGLAVFFALGRVLAARLGDASPRPPFAARKSLALFVVGLAGVYVLVSNPFSLLFLLPLLFWLPIGERRGLGRAANIVLFALGGLVVYALFYYFGFFILRDNLVILWYLMMMFSVGMISFATTLAITAIIAAGLSLVVSVPRGPAAQPARPPGGAR